MCITHFPPRPINHSFRPVRSSMVATSYMWLFKFRFLKIKYNENFTSLGALPTFQVINNHMRLLDTVLCTAGVENRSIITETSISLF